MVEVTDTKENGEGNTTFKVSLEECDECPRFDSSLIRKLTVCETVNVFRPEFRRTLSPLRVQP